MTDITFTHPDYKAHQHQFELVQDVYLGIDTAREHLTQLSNEIDTRFEERKKNCIINNMVDRIVKSSTGKIFRKQLMFEGVPDKIVKSFETVSTGKESLDQFAKNMTDVALRDGKAFVLIDAPRDGGEPYFSLIERGQLTNWKKDGDGNYIMAIIKERYKEDDGRYGFKYKEQYREIDEVGNVTIWRKNSETNKSDWHIHEEIITSYNFCPFYELVIAETPPLYDIAKENLLHMNLSSLRYRATVAYSDPFLAFYGMGLDGAGIEENPPVVIGVNQVMATDNTEGRIEWIELSGENFNIVKDQLTDFEQDIATRGLKMQSDSENVKTATQTREESSEGTSRLTDISIDLESTLNQAYEAYMMIKSGGKAVGEILVNRDFDVSVMESGLVSGLSQAVTAGNLSKETYLTAMVKHEVIELDSVDAELDRIDSEFMPIETVIDDTRR